VHLTDKLKDESTPIYNEFDGNMTEDNKKRTDEEIVNYYFEMNPSIISKAFYGLIKVQVKCGKCKKKSITYKPFSSLHLQLSKSLEKSIKSEF